MTSECPTFNSPVLSQHESKNWQKNIEPSFTKIQLNQKNSIAFNVLRLKYDFEIIFRLTNPTFERFFILIGTHFDSFVHTYTLFGKDLKRKEAPYLKRETTITQLLVSIRTHVLGEILPLAFGPTQKYHLTPRHAPKPSNLI